MPEEKDADVRVLLAEALWNDPDTRGGLEDLIAKKFPTASLPARAVRTEGAKILDDVRRERAELDKTLAGERSARELAEARRGVMVDPELRITAAEIPAIEKLMAEQLIGTHASAARLYRAQQVIAAPRATQTPMQIPGVMGAGGDEYKGIVEDPDAWSRAKALQVVHEFQTQRHLVPQG